MKSVRPGKIKVYSRWYEVSLDIENRFDSLVRQSYTAPGTLPLQSLGSPVRMHFRYILPINGHWISKIETSMRPIRNIRISTDSNV